MGTPSWWGGSCSRTPCSLLEPRKASGARWGWKGGRGEEEEAENNAGRLPAVGEQGGGLPPWPPPCPMAPSLEDSGVPCQQGELGAGRVGGV